MKLQNVVFKPIEHGTYTTVGVLYNDTLILDIGEVSDNEVIDLFFTVHNGAAICESLIHEEDNTSTTTHELLWNIKS